MSKESEKNRSCNCCRAKGCAVCCAFAWIVFTLSLLVHLNWQAMCIGPLFHADDVDVLRPRWAVDAEALRRAAASATPLLTERALPNAFGWMTNVATGSVYFEDMNFVQGFERPGCWSLVEELFSKLVGRSEPKWKPPVAGESMGIQSYQTYAKEHFGREFPGEFMQTFYTGGRVPSWEDNKGHAFGIWKLSAMVSASRAAGIDPITLTYPMEPRVAFDHRALTKMASDGFRYFGPMEIQYANNGFYGASLVERLLQSHRRSDLLGMLMTDSVFGAHLVYEKGTGRFHVDLSGMSLYQPIPGYAALGGKASFERDGSSLRTVMLEYKGKSYLNFTDPEVDRAYEQNNTRLGWRMAEGALIASLLSMTNLVMHVKDLHLEIAAAFQAVTVDAFSNQPKHPLRRLLDAFISRGVQATNDNMRLLFDFHAADFSLAPLPHDEQLKLIDDAIKKNPLNLAEMDMERYGQIRHMDPAWSTREAITNTSRWGWRWHYRAVTVQRLIAKYVECFLEAEGMDEDFIKADSHLKDWWHSLVFHLPSLRRATEKTPSWSGSGSEASRSQLIRVLSTIMVWVSWIHEDVGHSAAAYVNNPIYTPMCVPEDGVGVPLRSWVFNAMAYRGFVFLHRSVLLDEPPAFWFDGNLESRKCFETFQDSLRSLGETDVAFSECDKNGFFSCVDRVETAVSS